MRREILERLGRSPAAAWVVASAMALLPALAAGAATTDPWEFLAQARAALEDRPLVAPFTQTYLPAGFSQGETESGRMAVSLPACMRWDYEDPFPKGYLLCGDTAYTWNEGETTGRRQRIDTQSEPGLDLLLLSVERLRERYRAELSELEPGRTEILLVPADDEGFADARLVFRDGPGLPEELSYHDREGNLTRFELGEPLPLEETWILEPPSDLEWLEE